MRLAKLDYDLNGKKLAVSIKSKGGRKLINEGAILSKRIIDRLNASGLTAVYIEDDNYDIELHETMENDTMEVLYSKLQEIFTGIEKNEFNSIELQRFVRLDFLPEIKNQPVSIPAVQIKDQVDNIQHAINVAILAVRTAYSLGLNMDKIELAGFVSLIHDIGKILKNNDPKLINIPHYEVAFQFLKNKNCSVLSYMSIRLQEENYNGTGPYKVENSKQLDLAKIVHICDYYETLLSTRNLMPYECFEMIQALVNIKFDPEIFQAFRDSIYIYPTGLPVRLSNKEEGVIIKQNESYPLRPIIKTNSNYYNLMENLTLFIEKAVI